VCARVCVCVCADACLCVCSPAAEKARVVAEHDDE
jgi:hypothetical protein